MKRTWVSLFLLGFAGQIAWAVENQFFNIFMFDKIIPNPLYVSLMVALSAIVATLTSIVMGAFGDRIGRRRPFLLYGYIVWGVSITVVPMAEWARPALLAAWILIALDCLMTFFGSTAFDANYNAYLAEATDRSNRGRGQALLTLGTMLAILIVYGASGVVVSRYGYFVFFCSVGALVLVLGLAGGILIEEKAGPPQARAGLWESIRGTFTRESITRNRDFFMVLLAMGLWGMAFEVFFPFLLIYLNHFLEIPIDRSSLLIFVSILVGGIMAAYPSGWLADRYGRKSVSVASVFIISVSLYLFSQSREVVWLAVFGALWIGAQTAFTTATGAWSKDLYPSDKRGQFSGYMTMFTVAFTMVPGPLIGGLIAHTWGVRRVIEGREAVIPTGAIFGASAILVLLTLIPLYAVTERKPNAGEA